MPAVLCRIAEGRGEAVRPTGSVPARGEESVDGTTGFGEGPGSADILAEMFVNS